MSHHPDYEELTRLVKKLKAYFWKEVRTRIKHPNCSIQDPLTCSLTLPYTLRFFFAWWRLAPDLKQGSSLSARKLTRMASAAVGLSSQMDNYDNGDRCDDTYIAFLFMKQISDIAEQENLYVPEH